MLVWQGGHKHVYERVFAIVASIPKGKVVTYGQIARHLGMPHGARTVGWAMRQCPPGLPWHRVINGRGRISPRGKPALESLQRILLEEEGVAFDRDGHIELRIYGWEGI